MVENTQHTSVMSSFQTSLVLEIIPGMGNIMKELLVVEGVMTILLIIILIRVKYPITMPFL